MPKLWVLRLGHRLVRDDRMSSHLGLVARAFGADGMYLIGGELRIKKTIDDISNMWGGRFEVRLADDWRNIVRKWSAKDGLIVHLTMYGIGIDDVADEIRALDRDILVVVGAGKVPKDIYQMSNYNVAITHQPHSEIAALALFIDRLSSGEELKRNFKPSKIKVIPTARGKRVKMFDAKN